MKYWQNRSLENIVYFKDNLKYVEEWKDVVGWEGIYLISNLGRVKSLKRIVPHSHSGYKTIPEKVMTINKAINGYLMVKLSKGNKLFNTIVHRLVAIAFIPNPENKPEVNHKWGDKEDTRVSELEWVTKSENAIHSYDVMKRTKSAPMLGKVGKLHPNSKPIYCSTLGISFESSRIAERQLGISQGTISDICRGKQLQRDGLVFNFI